MPTNIRLSAGVLGAFKETGPGWQTRIDAGLWDLIERLKRDKGMPSADEVRALQRHQTSQARDDITDAEYRKRALDAMIERRKKAAGASAA